jgi:hypothetical protein
VVVWRVLVGLYVAANVAALVIVNADQSDWVAAAGIMAAASLALGWGTASGWGVVVALLMVPVALPFGDTDQFTGGGETDSVVLLAVVAAAISTLLILASAGARILLNRLQASAGAPKPQGMERNGTPHVDAGSPPNAVDVRHLEERESHGQRVGAP